MDWLGFGFGSRRSGHGLGIRATSTISTILIPGGHSFSPLVKETSRIKKIPTIKAILKFILDIAIQC